MSSRSDLKSGNLILAVPDVAESLTFRLSHALTDELSAMKTIIPSYADVVHLHPGTG